MSTAYQYTPYIWPMLTSVSIILVLVTYIWRYRAVPGARALTLMLIFSLFWAISAVLETAAVNLVTKLFWAKFKMLWPLPVVTARLCFVLGYANLNRWLSRRRLMLLTIPLLLSAAVILTNDAHHLIWRSFEFYASTVRLIRAPWSTVHLGYGLGLSALTLLVLGKLFVRSPLHRWAAALLGVGLLITLATFAGETAGLISAGPMDTTIVISTISLMMYVAALFHFRMLNLIPIARETVIEQMREGMVVLDPQQRIVDLNRAAEIILETPKARLRGRDAAQILPSALQLSAWLESTIEVQREISLGSRPTTARSYILHVSPLQDPRGFPLGHLLLFRDVTEQKQALAQLLDQQRALAMLQERTQLAREFHDGLGQTLAYIKMQTHVARDLLAQDEPALVDPYLARLASVAQEAHADIREYLISASTDMSAESSFTADLRRYLVQYRDIYGIRTELDIEEGWPEASGDPTIEVQLLRIAQEALTNVRKHASATCVRVSLMPEDGQLCMIIQDDGQGFDPGRSEAGEPTYGLRFMRERADMIGGHVSVQSAPGQGTRIVASVPACQSLDTRDELKEVL
jgi:PAS domain S-box-containing protein